MRSRLLAALLLAAAPLGRAEEHPAPPPPEVRGPAMPLARATGPSAEAPLAPAPVAEPPPPPSAAAPAGPLPPAPPAGDAGPTLAAPEPHPGATPAPGEDHAGGAARDAAAAAAAVRGRPQDRRPAPGAAREAAVPPALTGRALAEELRRSAGGRASEQEALAAERARLEKLSAEIADARAALKKETERLGELVKAAPGAGAGLGRRPGAKGAPPSALESISRTLKNMKPDQAAGLLGRLDRPLAAALLIRMKPGDAAAVLDRMNGEQSAALVTLLARKESP